MCPTSAMMHPSSLPTVKLHAESQEGWGRTVVVLCFLAAILASMPAAGREIAFQRVLEATSTAAWGAAAADIDGDGDLDLAVTDDVADTLRWIELAPGSHTATTISASVDGATGVVLGDFDGDGDPDVAVAARDVDDVLLWVNGVGGATWSGPVSVATSSNGVTDLAAGDLDGDGDLDLVGAVTDGGVIRRWLNDGSGTGWTPGPVSTLATGVSDIELADLDEDGDLDVVAAITGANQVRWFANNGSAGGWSATTIDTAVGDPVSVAVADLDEDGDPDVVGALQGSGEVVWWENTGGGATWQAAATVGSLVAVTAVGVADLDGDGDPDVAAASDTFGSTVGWFEQIAPLSWQWRGIEPSSPRQPRRLLLADLQSDGDVDLITPSAGNDSGVWTLENRDHRRRPRFRVYAAQDSGVIRDTTSDWALGDVDGDGRVDAVINGLRIAPQQDSLELVRAVPGGHPDILGYSRTFIGFSDGRADFLDVGDVDGDGDLDVFGGSRSLGEYLDLWENDGSGLAWTPHTVINDIGEPPFYEIALGDMDADGDLDVVGFLEQLGPSIERVLGWWEQVGDPLTLAGWTRHDLASATDASLLVREIRVGDVDADGDLDIVTAWDASTGDVVFWENIGGTPFAVTRHNLPTPGTRQFELADLDVDGDLDIAGEGAWWENVGGGVFARRPVAGMEALSVFDLDRDGDPDAVGGSCDDGAGGTASPCWWRNEVRNTLEDFFGTPLPNLTTSDWLLAADFDGDADGDLLGGPLFGFTASFRNQGGQSALAAIAVVDDVQTAGDTVTLFELRLEHGGTQSDPEVELATLALDFDAEGAPVDTNTLGAVVAALELWRDDGNGVRDAGDTLVLSQTALSADAGRVELVLPDDDPATRVAWNHPNLIEPGVFWLDLELEPDAGLHIAGPLGVTYDPAGGSVVEDSFYDAPLTIEREEPVRREIVVPMLFADGFESGDLTAWSSSVP